MARAVSPVVGVTLLLVVTLALAASVAVAIETTPRDPPPNARLSVDADATAERIAVTHLAGETLDVTTLSVTIEVDGEPLTHQPPVPFFAARGFESGPTGPFNSASNQTLRAGQIAGVRLAGTNSPNLTAGATVTVRIATERTVIHEETVTAGG